ncbi:MAG: glycosyltransferase family 2 protein, partial [Candidatus Dormibacteraceae bacterium]
MTLDALPPLVSCIMPTYNRRPFVARAIDYFLRQDYPAKELIVVDDGNDPVGDLMPADNRIRYVRLRDRATVGAKRNLACEQARGVVVAHWDDDDWHAPRRLGYQVEALLRDGADLCGLNRFLFYDPSRGCAWLYAYPTHQQLCLAGSTLCYRRALWERHRFPNVDVGEDVRFVQGGQSHRCTVLPDPTFHVGIIHRQNVSPKQTGGAHWHPYPVDEIRRLIGSDWRFYHPAANGPPDPVDGATTNRVSEAALAAAKPDDL